LSSNYGIEFIVFSNLFDLLQISEGLNLFELLKLIPKEKVKDYCADWATFAKPNCLAQAIMGWQPTPEIGEHSPWDGVAAVGRLPAPGGEWGWGTRG
jgi:hypothetical protein